jgi:glycosyltransferase involved in cell wall biosynthesis
MSYYRLDLFNELVKNTNLDIHVIFSSERENNDRNWEVDKQSLNFKYMILKSKSIKKKSDGIKETRIINMPKDVFKTLRNIDPDIVIGSEYNPTTVKAFFFCKLNGLCYISWSDGTLNSERFISKAQFILRKLLCGFSDGFIASGSETREAQISYGAKPDKVSVSFLTIDRDKFFYGLEKCKRSKNDVPVILFCGYLIKLKGVDLLLHALSAVKEDFRLDIVGSGVEEENLMELARKLCMKSKVRFLGYKGRTDIAAFYKNADMFVFPSMNDAFGLVLVEAITAGLPVISSVYAGGTKDTVDHGLNGFIIDPENTEDFAKKIAMLLSDEKLRKNMGAHSLEKSKSFSLNVTSKGFFEAIDRCERKQT